MLGLGGFLVAASGIVSIKASSGPWAITRWFHYPVLAGQYADYLKLQLQLFQAENRGGTNYAHLMQEIAKHLTEQQISELALYYESLGADSLQ